MSERPTAFERLSIAVGSSNLTMDTIHRGDLDFIVALGIASARNGAVASSLMRLHLASTPAALKTAYASVLGLTKRFNSKRINGLGRIRRKSLINDCNRKERQRQEERQIPS